MALLGSNGAGKSTTLRAISGLIPPQSGTMRFPGRDIGGLSPDAIVSWASPMCQRAGACFPGLTVRENILLGGSNRARPARRARG